MCSSNLSSRRDYPHSLASKNSSKKTRAHRHMIITIRMKWRRLQKRMRGRKETGSERMQLGDAEEMEMVNLKLYFENRCIMEENKMLKKKALVLREENQALLSSLQN